MKKTGLFIGVLAAFFGIAIANKMQKITIHKDSVKGKAKEAAGNMANNDKMKAEGTTDQVIGASKEVIEDVKDSISSVVGAGNVDKFSGETKKAIGDLTGDNKQKFLEDLDKAIKSAEKKASETKEDIKNTVEHVKDKVN